MKPAKNPGPSPQPKTIAPKSPSPSPKAPSPKAPASKPAPLTPPGPLASPKPAPKPTGGLLAKFRLLAVLAVMVLIARLLISGWLDGVTDPPSPSQKPSAPSAQSGAKALTQPRAAQAAVAQAAMSPASLPANALTTGAAMFLNANVAAFPAMAQSAAAAPPAIPLPPGDEDLRKPQKSPTPPTNQKNPNGPPLPPPANLTPAEAEEQAKRAFELSRRETQLNAREEAIKELEADLNARIAASEKSKAELADLLTRNQAILEEQKAAQEQKRSAEDAAKEARVEHLVLVLKGMKPEQAGQVINSMDDQVAVGILSVMPGSNAGKILAMVQPEKAARLIKAISEKRIDPKAILERQQSAQNQAPAAPETPAAPGS